MLEHFEQHATGYRVLNHHIGKSPGQCRQVSTEPLEAVFTDNRNRVSRHQTQTIQAQENIPGHPAELTPGNVHRPGALLESDERAFAKLGNPLKENTSDMAVWR